ncbi:hypothetical protein ACLI09_08895 [Flavobacterium sp. RHBU_24]|uniref:hypothetical protein n=1 Tax=Flavobacterium sp. RHBU_24 TaxID=3391185 RepID=UPI003984BAE3
MKSFAISLLICLILTSCGSDTIGKYKKEPLPDNFSYKIVEDESDETIEKNQLTVELNQKLTEGQIATLAEELFNSKPKQRRFYISYVIKDVHAVASWATSHFDPELEIDILGSTSEQDLNAKKNADSVDGEIVGKWDEDEYTFDKYVIYKKNKKTFLKTLFKDGQQNDEELTEKTVDNGIRYDYKNGGSNGEYFILNSDNELEFYNKENKNFTTAKKL